jgi:hypothetical protein
VLVPVLELRLLVVGVQHSKRKTLRFWLRRNEGLLSSFGHPRVIRERLL